MGLGRCRMESMNRLTAEYDFDGGRYWILDCRQEPSGHIVMTSKYVLEPSYQLAYANHSMRSKVWVVTDGDGEFIHNGESRQVRAGDVLQIMAGKPHCIRAVTEMKWAEVQVGIGGFNEVEEQLKVWWGELELMDEGVLLQ